MQWTGTKRAKPETEIKKQLPPGKEEVRRLETQQSSSLKALPRSPPAVRVGGDSQDSGKRKLLQAGSWGWGWKCQEASEVAMATETKRVAEEWLGTGIPKRGPTGWWSLGKPRLSLLDRSSGLLVNGQPFRRVYRVSFTQLPGLFQVSGLQVLITCLSLNFVIGFFICSVGGAPQLCWLLRDNREKGAQPTFRPT